MAQVTTKGAAWARDFVRQLELRLLREDGARRVANVTEKYRRLRRAEERLTTATLKLKQSLRRPTRTRSDFERFHALILDSHGIVLDADRPFLEQWRAHVDQLARQLGATIVWAPEAAGVNAYAWTSLRRIEIAPITSAGLYATALHELGHVARACSTATHRRVAVEGGSVCVQCELDAWRWAMAQARPTWTSRMHVRLAQSLPTYRRHATTAEADQVDMMASALGRCEAQQQRLRQGRL